MPTEYSLVIADTSCFILLDKIDRLDVLQRLFNEVYTTRRLLMNLDSRCPTGY